VVGTKETKTRTKLLESNSLEILLTKNY
jgi:hypothetical protein